MGFPLFSDFSSPLLSLEVADGNFEGRPRVLTVLSALLDRIVRASELRHKQSHLSHQEQQREEQNLTIFHGLRAPGISIDKYLDRIHKYANCSPSCFVVAYVYLDRVSAAHPNDLSVSSLNVHRLVITAVMTAAKFLDDSYFNNAYYAKVGGVTTEEMNRLELEFLFRIGFRLNVTMEEFHAYCTLLEAELWKISSRGPNTATPFSCAPIVPNAAPLSVLAAGTVGTQVDEAQSHSRPITPPTPTFGDSEDGSAMDLTMSQHRQPHPSTVVLVANQQEQHIELQCQSHLQQAPEQCRGHGAPFSAQQAIEHLVCSNNHSHEQQQHPLQQQQQPHDFQHLLHEQQHQQHQLLQGQLRQYLELQQLQQQQHEHLQQQMQQQLRMQQQQAQQSWWNAHTEQQQHQQLVQHQHYEQQQQQQQQHDRHQYRHSWSFSDARATEKSAAVQSSPAAASIPRSVTAPSLPPVFPVASHAVVAASPALSSTSSLSSSCCDWEEAEDVEYGDDECSSMHDKSAVHRPGCCAAGQRQVYSYELHQHLTLGQQQQQLLLQQQQLQQQQQQVERAPAALTPPRNCEAPIRVPRCYSYCVAE